MRRYILRYVLFLLVAAVFFLSSPVPAAAHAAEWNYLYLPFTALPSRIVYKTPAVYVVDKYVTVSNTNFNLTKLEIYMPGAVSWDSQAVTTSSFYPPLTSQTLDPSGNRVLYWKTTAAPAPGQSMDFGQLFTLTVYAVEAQVIPSDVLPYDTGSALYQQYTRSEYRLEASDALIIQAAQDAVGSETNPYLKAKQIFQYVAEHLHYEFNDGLQGARLTLQLGSGECGDYASVFVAMARAAGIPARPVVGYHAQSGEQYHVWAEFYLQGIGWVPADAQFGDMGGTADFWYLGNNPNTRVIMSKNFNIPLLPSTRTADLFQTYSWWYWGSGTGMQSVGGWEVFTP